MIQASRRQWIKFAVVLVLYLIFLLWLQSWLGLIVVPFIFDAYICDNCGEKTGANWIHLQNGKKLCPDCYVKYDRFRI